MVHPQPNAVPTELSVRHRVPVCIGGGGYPHRPPHLRGLAPGQALVPSERGSSLELQLRGSHCAVLVPAMAIVQDPVRAAAAPPPPLPPARRFGACKAACGCPQVSKAGVLLRQQLCAAHRPGRRAHAAHAHLRCPAVRPVQRIAADSSVLLEARVAQDDSTHMSGNTWTAAWHRGLCRRRIWCFS